MSATAHQLRRRLAAAESIAAKLNTKSRRKRFVRAVPLDCATLDQGALYDAIARRTDYLSLIAMADKITSSRGRWARK